MEAGPITTDASPSPRKRASDSEVASLARPTSYQSKSPWKLFSWSWPWSWSGLNSWSKSMQSTPRSSSVASAQFSHTLCSPVDFVFLASRVGRLSPAVEIPLNDTTLSKLTFLRLLPVTVSPCASAGPSSTSIHSNTCSEVMESRFGAASARPPRISNPRVLRWQSSRSPGTCLVSTSEGFKVPSTFL